MIWWEGSTTVWQIFRIDREQINFSCDLTFKVVGTVASASKLLEKLQWMKRLRPSSLIPTQNLKI